MGTRQILNYIVPFAINVGGIPVFNHLWHHLQNLEADRQTSNNNIVSSKSSKNSVSCKNSKTVKNGKSFKSKEENESQLKNSDLDDEDMLSRYWRIFLKKILFIFLNFLLFFQTSLLFPSIMFEMPSSTLPCHRFGELSL